nr:aldose epimerase family protein [uncultured Celeribacter sp.]
MIRRFGQLQDGRPVEAITLQAGSLSATILNYGAILNDVRLAGVPYGLTLGSPDLAAYDHGPMDYFGALVGPVANRISGASAELDGERFQFEANEGPNTLHGGPKALHNALWQLAEHSESAVMLEVQLPDGAGGFPGNRHLRARYSIEAPARLRMDLWAKTDRATFLNLANHSYWNLDGTKTTEGHWLQVRADRYTTVDDHLIPTGVADVTGTAFDLRGGRVLRPSDSQRYDTNFCLSEGPAALRHVATLTGTSGISLRLSTTEAGLQVFDAAPIGSAPFIGHRGFVETGFCGIALEAQNWPDAPNRPEFPSSVLRPETLYHQTTQWQFSKPGDVMS